MNATAIQGSATNRVRRTIQVRRAIETKKSAVDVLIMGVDPFKIDLAVKRGLVCVRKDACLPSKAVTSPVVTADRKLEKCVVIVVESQAILFEVVLALSSSRGFAGLLDCWQ